MTRAQHDRMANAIRALAMDAVEQAKSGIRLPMGAADVATVLFTRFLKFDPDHPAWPDRDRFVLSAGHGSMLIYALLHLLNYRDDDRGDQALSQLARSHRAIRNTATRRRGDHHRPSPGLANASAWRSPRRIWRPSSARTSSTTAPMCSPPRRSDGGHQPGSDRARRHLRLNKLVVLFDDNGIPSTARSRSPIRSTR